VKICVRLFKQQYQIGPKIRNLVFSIMFIKFFILRKNLFEFAFVDFIFLCAIFSYSPTNSIISLKLMSEMIVFFFLLLLD